MTNPEKPHARHLTTIAGALLGLAFILHLRRYAGINHDSVLYLGQGLVRRWPEIFSSDTFFANGSQERYSLFPWLLGMTFGHFDPPDIFLWGTLVCLLGFSAASWYCLRSLLPSRQRYWAWLAVLALPSAYSFKGMFAYSEQFLTPRPIAEILSVVAIGLLARRHWALGMASIVVAGLFHPLQAIAAMLIVWPWLIMQDRRWLHAAWLGIPIVGFAIAGIRPFDDLLRQADPAWLESLKAYTGQLFLSRWTYGDYALLGFQAAVLAYACRALRGVFGSWCLAALIGLTLGFAASMLLVDILHLVLPAELQLWRVQWLANWFAMAAIGALLFRDIDAREFPRALLLALVLLLTWNLAIWMAIPVALLYVAWPRVFAASNARFRTALGWLFGLAIAFLFASYVSEEWLPFRMAHYRLDLYAIDRRILAYPFAGLTPLLLGTWAWQKATEKWRWVMVAAILCPVIALGAARWDSRPLLNRMYEQNAFHSDIFGSNLPERAKIFWDDDSLTGPWLVLRRASYFSPGQLAGQVFNRDTAMDANRRLDRMRPLIEEGLYCRDRSRPLHERETCHVSGNAMFQACTPLLGQAPDYLVLTYSQPQHAIGEWVILDPVTQEPAITYRLYKCSDVLQNLRRSRTALANH